ncbi:MAG TPA: 4-carboxy-4-hydroxy-2-oxoadipate aldolase/oxaloacetate decarboxylase [Kofleriaceae bacterium]|nr:4-carboxy-4-hydroxy-2-oxoadipate aldolase/oxaloacetate decarboxylase [Kofleriaceae bacterium]
MGRARRTFERPPVDQVATLGRYATTVLSDAMGRAGAMSARLRPLGPAVRMAGPALTVRLYPNDNFMCHLAVALAQPGDVLVIDGGNYLEAAVWGEMLTLAAIAKGVAGVVVDAAARDRDAIAGLGLPVFASAVVPRGTFKRHAGDANVPIACGGLAVAPGDIVVSDADGVVVIPRARAAEVIERVHEAEQREASWRAALAEGTTLYELAGIDAMLAGSGIEWE